MSKSEVLKQARLLETETIVHQLKIYRIRSQENPRNDDLRTILDALRSAYKEKTGRKSDL